MFMRLHRFTISMLLAAAIPAYALAQQVETTPIPAPKKPPTASMAFMIGTWTCTTKSARRPGPYTTISTYTMDPDGYWIDEVSTVQKNSWIPKTLSTTDKITYDSDTHRWVDVTYGDGGQYGLAFSPGWNGNSMTWHDVSFAAGSDIKSQTDNVTVKVSNTKTTASSTFTETKTGRVVSVSTVCTKH
jgi:hypothetical protein